jgi:teichoic acid transport system permease protein
MVLLIREHRRQPPYRSTDGPYRPAYTRAVMATIGATTSEPAHPRFAYLRELWSRREFTWHLARGNLAARNADSTLGKVWWILNPLIMSGVYFVVFGLILTGSERSKADFLGYLIIGVFVYRFMSQGLMDASKLLLNNEKLIVNIRFPRMVLPLAAVIESLTMFVISLPIFYLLVTPISCIQATGNPEVTCVVPTWRTTILPLNILLLGLFTLGIGALFARWVLPVRDVRDLIPHLTRIWFYFSPILWGTERLERFDGFARTIIELNPMYSFLSLFRFAMIGDPFSSVDLIRAVAWTLVVTTIGIWVFVRNEDDMARYL